VIRDPKAARDERFADAYGRPRSLAERRVERDVFGTSAGVISYTTVEQADVLAGALRLGRGTRLLDVGAGVGWPGLYLAKKTGCRVMLTDVPVEAVLGARARARKRRMLPACSFAVASGTHLPFRHAMFDAVVHTDVL